MRIGRTDFPEDRRGTPDKEQQMNVHSLKESYSVSSRSAQAGVIRI
ncbi:hypothetical protein [Paenibacillus sp. PvR148]